LPQICHGAINVIDIQPDPLAGQYAPAARISWAASYYTALVKIHPSARRHGVADEDIEHAVTNAMAIDDQEDDTRLYLGPARNADLLEVATIVGADGSKLAIHAMRMRSKYNGLLPGG